MLVSMLLRNELFQLPRLSDTRQMLQNARTMAVAAVALAAFSSLQVVSAGKCEDTELICVKSCLGGGDGREAGACLIGCKLAYLFCKWFSRK